MTKNPIELLEEHEQKMIDVHYNFIRQVVLLASSLFGVLISIRTITLKPEHSPVVSAHSTRIPLNGTLSLLSTLCDNPSRLLAFSISEIGVGILFLVIALYGQVVLHGKIRVDKGERAYRYAQNMQKKGDANISISPFYKYATWCGYSLLCLSVLSLSIFVLMDV